ncbi:MAG TPA: B12-binding domain-containing radical SAM protein [Desulfobacterales bacterium]
MKIALIFPPIADPTAPYISLPSLTAWLRSHAIEVVPIDANLEAIRYLLQPHNLETLGRRVRKRLGRLERTGVLPHRQQLAYAALFRADRIRRSTLQHIEAAVSLFHDRSGDRFFNPVEYVRAASTVEGALALISAAYTPLEMDFTRYRTPFALLSMDQIRSDARADRNPFTAYYSGPLAERLAAERVALVGVSVAYTSQIQQAYTLGAILRRRFPHLYLTVGGPALTQMLLRLAPALRSECLGPFDSAVMFEGEQVLLEIVRMLAAGRPAVGVLQAEGPTDLSRLPAPDFDGLPLQHYLRPAPVLPYDPTRGCYWGKCAFCHYGLAEKGTAPYRERPLEAVLQHLEMLSRRHDCRLFYLSQDLMAPAAVHRFAREVRKTRLTWRWATDLRADRYFSAGVCKDLAAGGALAVSLGVESGAARILRRIRKGIPLADMEAVIQNLAAAGVAVEVMCFTDFPSESYAEAMATLQLLQTHFETVALFMCGRFQLTSGSAVACRPSDFDIREIWHVAGDELRSVMYFTENSPPKTAGQAGRIEAGLSRIAGRWRLQHYPWAGSLSTAHTLLWYERFGPQAFKKRANKTARGFGLRIEAGNPGLPADVRKMAERAFENETALWQKLIYQERAVTPELYRRLANNLPSQRLFKPGPATRGPGMVSDARHSALYK